MRETADAPDSLSTLANLISERNRLLEPQMPTQYNRERKSKVVTKRNRQCRLRRLPCDHVGRKIGFADGSICEICEICGLLFAVLPLKTSLRSICPRQQKRKPPITPITQIASQLSQRRSDGSICETAGACANIADAPDPSTIVRSIPLFLVTMSRRTVVSNYDMSCTR